MASAVTTPLERQFGQMPSLSSMTSVSSFGSSQITLQFTSTATSTPPSRTFKLRSTPRRACCRRPRCPTPPVYNKANPADHADPHAQLSARTTLSLDAGRRRSPTRSSAQKISAGLGRRPRHDQRWAEARRSRPSRSAIALAGAGLYARARVRTALVAANINQPKGNLDGAAAGLRAMATDDQLVQGRLASARSSSRTPTARPCGSPTSPTSVDGVENAQLAGWAWRTSARSSSTSSGSRGRTSSRSPTR